MTIYYEGVDITASVNARSCVVRDEATGRADSLDIVFEDAGQWISWKPEEDQRIRVTQDGYDSGEMYVHTVAPEDRRFRVLATSLRCAARQKEYRSFSGQTIGGIMSFTAAQTGMDYRAFGLNTDIEIPYIEQEFETAAAFLCRLMKLEGATLKCVQGRYTGIGLQWAQARSPVETVRITPSQDGARYSRTGQRLRRLTVATPSATAAALDTDAPATCPELILGGLAARSYEQALRWATGLLTHINRRAEELRLDTIFNPRMTAMERVNVTGGTDADGAWLVDEVEHDLIERTTTAILRRCVTGVGAA